MRGKNKNTIMGGMIGHLHMDSNDMGCDFYVCN